MDNGLSSMELKNTTNHFIQKTNSIRHNPDALAQGGNNFKRNFTKRA
jgi:hypothetical protein